MKFTTQQKLKIINLLMEGVNTKRVAQLMECNVWDVYSIRDQYLEFKLVLKKHPKTIFNLEE